MARRWSAVRPRSSSHVGSRNFVAARPVAFVFSGLSSFPPFADFASRFGRTRAPAEERIHPGESTARRRYLDAFVGGALLLFGARLAGGCTSGPIISGITQLAMSGLLFGAAVFASGIVTAKLLARRA